MKEHLQQLEAKGVIRGKGRVLGKKGAGDYIYSDGLPSSESLLNEAKAHPGMPLVIHSKLSAESGLRIQSEPKERVHHVSELAVDIYALLQPCADGMFIVDHHLSDEQSVTFVARYIEKQAANPVPLRRLFGGFHGGISINPR